MIRKFPLAFISFLVGILSFFHLFGLEKAVLAIILGALALGDFTSEQQGGKKYAYTGIILGSLYVFVLLVIMFARGPEILKLIGKLR